MEPTYFAQYRGFEFQCSPERLGDNAFVPRLLVCDSSGTNSLQVPLVVPDPPFTNSTVAARQAFAQGRRWVDSGIDAPSGGDIASASQVLDS